MKKGRSLAAVAAAVCALSFGSTAEGAASYSVLIDTSAFAGMRAQLALDFIDGGPPSNTVSISGFATDGTLGSQSAVGGVSGTLPGAVLLADTAFFNEILIDITPASLVSFVFTPSANGPDFGSLPDAFSVFLLDPDSGLSLIATLDPTGADSLLQFDIDGSLGGTSAVFSDRVTVSVTPFFVVSEPSSLALWLTGLTILTTTLRRRGSGEPSGWLSAEAPQRRTPHALCTGFAEPACE
jgi:hypothetical protein